MQCVTIVWLALGALVIACCGVMGAKGQPSTETGSPYLYCSNYNPQTTLQVHQITGLWYGSELLQHHDGDNRSTIVNSCVVIHISETPNEPAATPPPTVGVYADDAYKRYYGQAHRNQPAALPGFRYLRLVWEENGVDREVALRYNESHPGFWESAKASTIQSAADPAYQIYTGTLQVMKAVENHLVITFCQTLRETGELFSILLTRRPNTLTNEDTMRIRSMLRRRGLETTTVRKVCKSAAWRAGGVSVWTAAASMAVIMIGGGVRWF